MKGLAPRGIGWYREFAPCKALQANVYALFSFLPEPAPVPPYRTLLREIAFSDPRLCAPQLADGHVSFSFELGQTWDVDGRWEVDSRALRGTVVGPLRAVGRTEPGNLSSTVGVFFRPARVDSFLRIPISELTDCTVAIDDVWGTVGSRLPSEFCELDEAARIDRLESILLKRLEWDRRREGALDIAALATSILRWRGRMTVDTMARVTGVSRQHLSREFRERIGVAPKLYSRLARFQSGLVYAGSRARVDWARVALDMGYVDQSHMIAEFREFGGLTPRTLASCDWFHPFIERAKSFSSRTSSQS